MFPEITKLLPHRFPMLMIDALVECNDQSAKGEKIFRQNDYGLSQSKVLDSVLIECLAQTVAAMKGFHFYEQGLFGGDGMLVGVNHFEFFASANVDCLLTFQVEVTRNFGPFTFVHGIAKENKKILAQGNLKFYVQEKEE